MVLALDEDGPEGVREGHDRPSDVVDGGRPKEMPLRSPIRGDVERRLRRDLPPPGDGVDGEVVGDPVQPCSDWSVGAVVRRGAECAEERFLGDVLGERVIAGDAEGSAEYESLMARHELAEGVRIIR